MKTLWLVLFVSSAVWAEESTKEPAASGHHEGEGAKEEPEESWREHRNWLTAFGGATVSFIPGAETEAGPALGLDYSYRLSRYFGLGVFVDYTFLLNELVVGPAFFIYPVGGLYLEVAPSLELALKPEKPETQFIGRLALGYEFELTPQLALGAYVAGDWWRSGFGIVPGVTFAYGF